MVIRNFVVFEGGDGSGTSTQLKLLERRLAAAPDAPPYSIGYEPTDGPIGLLIRSALCGKTPLRPDTVARLFAADRGEHLFEADGVVERTARGELVVSDRYVPSSLVYQGIACAGDLPARLNEDFPKPELVLHFDIDPREALKRIDGRRTKDDFEKLDFQLLVRERYARELAAYAEGGTKLVRIDASATIAEVSEEVWREVRKLPIFGR